MKTNSQPCRRPTLSHCLKASQRIVFWFCFAAPLLFCVSAHSQTLSQALDATNLTWTTSTTGGASPWSGETGTSHDGVSAATSFVSFSGQTSTLQTTVTGPGTLTFWWYGSESSFGNPFSCSANNVVQASYTRYGAWVQQTIYLGSGTQTLKWIHSGGSTSGSAYLDQVNYTSGATAPIITAQPFSQSQVQGIIATFALSSVGTPPLSYQWQFNSTNIPGATNFSFTVTNIQSTNLGIYKATVTNSVGPLVSSNASLEFGQITAWGFGADGETSVSTGATNILAVSCGSYHNLALRMINTFLGWGRNTYGQITIPANLTNGVAGKGGAGSSLALTSDGSIFAWGFNNYGQTDVPAGLSNTVAISAGDVHGMALKADGTVVVWGSNAYGQTNVPNGLSNVVAIAAGDNVCLALKADGSITAWGKSDFGETNVPSFLTNVVAISAGTFHCIALKTDGTVTAWGYNSQGQTNVPAGLTNVVAIAAGGFHNLGLRANGTVVAWGRNFEGQTNVPINLTNVVAIDAGEYHSLALVGNSAPIRTAPLVNPTISSNGFSLSLPSQSGMVYALEYKNSLTDSNWVDLPLVAGNGTNLVLMDASATNDQRVYRVRRW